ncbi:MAG: hypothetical protein Kow0029_27530 [Candidatus Rifleibacteriota bacterium]
MNKKLFVFAMVCVAIISAGSAFAVTTHIMEPGDTLWELAAKHYGDPTLYPVLLEVNGIDNPRTIPNGRVIIIPDKSAMQKIAKESDPAKKRALINQAKGSTGKTSIVSPVDSGNSGVTGNTNSGADSASRGGEAVDPDDTSFTNILKGPKVSPEKLIKTNDH